MLSPALHSLGIIAIALAGLMPQTYAQSSSCNGYRILSETIASAGGVASSNGGTYTLVDTSGQTAVGGISFGPTYMISAGDIDALHDPLPIWPTYLAWKQAFFTPAQQSDSSISGPIADFDRDQFVNLFEYATGSDPASAGSAARPFLVIDPTNASLIYKRNLAATDVTYANPNHENENQTTGFHAIQ